MTSTVILASGSEIRHSLLRNAGIAVQVRPARVDEDTVRAALVHDGTSPRDIADALAELKAARIGGACPEAYVIGCDQILECDGGILSKPVDRSDAIRQLRALRGKAHDLWSAAVLCHEGRPVWRHIGHARLEMRSFSDAYLDDYVTRNWDAIRTSVGGYQIEAEGIRLFSRISGDHFSILGLPLLELLTFLTTRGVIDR